MAGYVPTNPDIARAYENDPRLAIAQSMIKNGTSTAPVAQGGWGVTDGAARALQSIVGAYMQKKVGQKYQKDEDALNATVASAFAPQPPVAGPPAGAAPPAQGQGMPQGAQQPPAPQMAPGGPQPGGMPPQAGAMPPQAGGMPAPPAPTGDLTSHRTRIGQALLASGNKYASNLGMQMMQAGLGDEQTMQEQRNNQQFQTGMAGYQSQLQDWQGTRQDARTAATQEAQQKREFDQQWKIQTSSQGFQASQSDKNRAFEWKKTQYDAAKDFKLEGMREGNARDIAATKAGAGKPLPPSYVKSLTEDASQFMQLHQLATDFKRNYVGSLTGPTGRASMAVNNVLANVGFDTGDENRQNWWKQYDNLNLGMRHGTFGARLTPTEIEMWDQANISPSTNGSVSGSNLRDKYNVASGALTRTVRAALAAGYNPEQIMETIGPDAAQVMSQPLGNPELYDGKAQGAAPQGAATHGAPPQTLKMGNDTYTKINGQWVKN